MGVFFAALKNDNKYLTFKSKVIDLCCLIIDVCAYISILSSIFKVKVYKVDHIIYNIYFKL